MSATGYPWPESEIDTLTSMEKVQVVEQDPKVARTLTPAEQEELDDEILRLAFGRVMKQMRRRTYVLIFVMGMMTGFVALGVTLVVLLTRAGV